MLQAYGPSTCVLAPRGIALVECGSVWLNPGALVAVGHYGANERIEVVPLVVGPTPSQGRGVV